MGRYVYEAKTRVDFVPAIASIAAPTTTELNAGTRLDSFITKDGLTTPDQQNMVNSAALSETFDAQEPGSWGGAITLKMFRDDASDDAWDLVVYGTRGFIVVRRGPTAETAWASSQKVEVYPVAMHEPVPVPSAANEDQMFTAQMAVTSQPNKRAVVA